MIGKVFTLKSMTIKEYFAFGAKIVDFFYFNPNSTQQPQSQQLMSPNPSACAFNSKSFNLNFVPTDCFPFWQFHPTDQLKFSSKITKLPCSLLHLFPIQIAQIAKCHKCFRCFCMPKGKWKDFLYFTVNWINFSLRAQQWKSRKSDGFNLQLISQCHLTVPSKFIWSESKELFNPNRNDQKIPLKWTFQLSKFLACFLKNFGNSHFLIGGIFHSSWQPITFL